MKITAAVVRNPEGEFLLEQCDLADPRAGEVLLRIEACGICHTDIAARDQDMPVPLPAVLGHEGVGYIEQLGPDVSDFEVGDRVVVSFGSCGQCHNCKNHAPGYCHNGIAYFLGSRLDGSSPISQDGKPITGHFFAQSSMATYAVASTQNMVKLDKSVPAEVAAPLACGVQTGVGSVLLAMEAKPSSAIVILGCGTVGLSAIMGAKIAGCSTIIAVDLMPARLELAKELGATHCIQAGEGNLTEQLLELGGVDYGLDTTGVPAVVRSTFDALRAMGTLVCVGVGKPGVELNLDMNMLMMTGRKVRGAIEGDAVPKDFIPQLLDYHAKGQLPVEKLVTSYPFVGINEAVADALEGRAVKPVLLMD